MWKHHPISAHAWLLSFGQLSDGPSSASTAQPSTEPNSGCSPASAKPTTSTPSATSSILTATSKNMFQLRQPIALRNRLPANRSRSKTSAAASKLLSHEPIRRMDLPVSAAWNESGGFSSITASERNRSLLHQLWPD